MDKQKRKEVNRLVELIRPLNIVCNSNDCDKCPISEENRLCTEERVARFILEYYQPKIDKDSVVLSREEYNTLKAENDKYVKDCINYLATINKLENKVWEVEQQVRKETAEKILNELNNLIKNNEDFGRGIFGWKTEEILMLLKIYADKQGVEIKE